MDPAVLRRALDAARRAGAAAAEAWFDHRVGTSVVAVRGRPAEVELPPTCTLRLRVWTAEGRSADGDPEQGGIDAIVARAATGAPRPGPVDRAGARPSGLSIRDRRWGQIHPEDRADVVVSAERAVRQAGRGLVARGFTYTEILRTRCYANTAGLALEEGDTVFTCAGTVDGEGVSRSDAIRSRTFSSVASVPLGLPLGRRVADLVGPAAAFAGPVRVALPPPVVARLVDRLARTLVDGAASFLAATPLHPALHLQDDAALPGGLRSWSFDDAGVVPRPLVLLREGVVFERYVGSGAARRGRGPTGHEAAGEVRPANLLLRAGARPLSAALDGSPGPVLVVDELDEDGLHGETGRLDAHVSGHLRAGGRRRGAVLDGRLRGDLARALVDGVEVCGDADRVGHVDAPALVLDGLDLSA